MPNPAGGEAEYFADSDYADDNWQPRLWEPDFGAFQWAGKLPPMLEREIAWKEPQPLPNPIPKFSELGGQGANIVRLSKAD